MNINEAAQTYSRVVKYVQFLLIVPMKYFCCGSSMFHSVL